MDKEEILHLIIKKLKKDLDTYFRAASSASDEATDEHNKPEGKYDTRGLEASYLAHGQAKQALQAKADIDSFETLILSDFDDGQTIDIGALVELRLEEESIYYFVGPASGGAEIEYNNQEISVVTPSSPIGKVLIGKTIGHSFSIGLGSDKRNYKIENIF